MSSLLQTLDNPLEPRVVRSGFSDLSAFLQSKASGRR